MGAFIRIYDVVGNNWAKKMGIDSIKMSDIIHGVTMTGMDGSKLLVGTEEGVFVFVGDLPMPFGTAEENLKHLLRNGKTKFPPTVLKKAMEILYPE